MCSLATPKQSVLLGRMSGKHVMYTRPSLKKPIVNVVVATAQDDISTEENEIVTQLKDTFSRTSKTIQEKWDATEEDEKPAAIAIIIGVIVAQIVIGGSIDAIDRIPILKQVLELIGIGVTAVYGFRLLTIPEERKALSTFYDSFIAKVVGKES